MRVVKVPPKPDNDSGIEFVVTVHGRGRDVFKIGGGGNALCSCDAEINAQTVKALRYALMFLDDSQVSKPT